MAKRKEQKMSLQTVITRIQYSENCFLTGEICYLCTMQSMGQRIQMKRSWRLLHLKCNLYGNEE